MMEVKSGCKTLTLLCEVEWIRVQIPSSPAYQSSGHKGNSSRPKTKTCNATPTHSEKSQGIESSRDL